MTDNFNNKPNPEVVDNSGPSITHGDSEIGFEATSKKPDNVSTAPRNFSF